MSHLAVGVHKSLLIDTANALQGTDLEGILGAQVARVGRFYLATRFIIQLLSLERLDLRFSQNDAFINR